jgi:hypothetical protein
MLLPCDAKTNREYSTKLRTKTIVEVMAAAALQGKPGLATVINALAQFRKDLTSGVLNMAPRDCFKPEKNIKKCSLTRSFAKLLIRNFHVQPTANPPSWAYIYICV